MRAFSYFVVRIAVAMLGNGAARRFLESPSWGATESPPIRPNLDVDSHEIDLPGCPFDVIASSDGDYVFVSLHQPGGTQRTPGSIAVLRRIGESLCISHQIPLTAAPWGLALVREESLLAVANSHGVTLLDVRAARDPAQDPVVGAAFYGHDLQTIRVLESKDGQWLYATDEHNRTVSILDLRRTSTGEFDAECLVSQVPMELAPLGIVLSPDGRYLYVTCEMCRVAAPDLVNWFVWGATLSGSLRRAGVLSTINLAAAVHDPEHAVVANSIAGGHPVRIQLAADGRTAWVTARASNQLIAFRMEKPESPVVVAATPVGPAPVGLTLLDGPGVALVANSNRFASDGTRGSLSVIDLECAVNGMPACLGQIEVGSFPREISVDRYHGLVYVTNFDSRALTLISIPSIERAVKAARSVPLES